jgi:hypothetical protein
VKRIQREFAVFIVLGLRHLLFNYLNGRNSAWMSDVQFMRVDVGITGTGMTRLTQPRHIDLTTWVVRIRCRCQTCQEYMNILAISIIDVSSSGNSCSGPLPQTS